MNNVRKNLGIAAGFCAALVALAVSGETAAQNAASGAQAYAAKCQVCHSIDRTRGSAMAPNLAGVVGRKAGTLPKFMYSPAMTRSNIVWNPSNLDAFLSPSQRLVRGSRMAFAGVSNPKERSDIIAFLSSKN
jgi:cytochrome c